MPKPKRIVTATVWIDNPFSKKIEEIIMDRYVDNTRHKQRAQNCIDRCLKYGVPVDVMEEHKSFSPNIAPSNLAAWSITHVSEGEDKFDGMFKSIGGPPIDSWSDDDLAERERALAQRTRQIKAGSEG